MDIEDPSELAEPANLKFLRVLVSVLTGTMILGVLVLITLIVIRFNETSTSFPGTITLPAGTNAQAFTQTKHWYAVVTQDDRILIYNRDTDALVQEIQVQSTGTPGN